MTAYEARVLAHDGQVLERFVIDGPWPEIRIAVPPRLSELLKEPSPTPAEFAELPYRVVRAVYERTAGDGTRIYRLRVNLT